MAGEPLLTGPSSGSLVSVEFSINRNQFRRYNHVRGRGGKVEGGRVGLWEGDGGREGGRGSLSGERGRRYRYRSLHVNVGPIESH